MGTRFIPSVPALSLLFALAALAACSSRELASDGGRADTGPDAPPASACIGLAACACLATPGCAPIAEACWCPFPECDPAGACVCGGGRFISCGPTETATCAAARARVAALCPLLDNSALQAACDAPAPLCATKCLAEVRSCGDVTCAFCLACDCAGDAYTACYQSCVNGLAR